MAGKDGRGFVNADGSLLAPQYGRFEVETWADAVSGYKRGWAKTLGLE